MKKREVNGGLDGGGEYECVKIEWGGLRWALLGDFYLGGNSGKAEGAAWIGKGEKLGRGKKVEKDVLRCWDSMAPRPEETLRGTTIDLYTISIGSTGE